MISIKVDENAIRLQEKNIDKMMTTDPETRKRIQEFIRVEIIKARNRLADDLKAAYPNSEHQSYRAVRSIVYQKVLGANLNILDKKKGTATWKVRQKTRKVEQNPKMRGGNRMKRSQRTIMLDGYEPSARGFVLRFLEEGTKQRFTGGRNSARNYYKMVRSGRGNRGSLTATHLFAKFANQEIGVAAEAISRMIDAEMEQIYNNKK